MCNAYRYFVFQSDESSYDEEASEASVSTESSDSAPDWDELEEKARRGTFKLLLLRYGVDFMSDYFIL